MAAALLYDLRPKLGHNNYVIKIKTTNTIFYYLYQYKRYNTCCNVQLKNVLKPCKI